MHATAAIRTGMRCHAGRAAVAACSREEPGVGSKADGWGFEWPMTEWRAAAWAMRCAEFISAMKKYLYLDFNEATLNNLFAAFDPENTGCIDFDRFTTLVMGGGSQRELTRSTSLPMVKMMTSSLLRSGVSGVSLPRFYEDPYRVC